MDVEQRRVGPNHRGHLSEVGSKACHHQYGHCFRWSPEKLHLDCETGCVEGHAHEGPMNESEGYGRLTGHKIAVGDYRLCQE